MRPVKHTNFGFSGVPKEKNTPMDRAERLAKAVAADAKAAAHLFQKKDREGLLYLDNAAKSLARALAILLKPESETEQNTAEVVQ